MHLYDARAVANYFLQLGHQEDIPISQLKLQKLVFLAQGWNLGIYHRPLIRQDVHAWRHGPVIPDLYQEFRHFGSEPIDHEAGPPGQRPKIPDYDSQTTELLDTVWAEHKKFSGVQLSAMTHKKGSPWHQVLLQNDGKLPRNAVIPSSIIEEHYTQLAADG